MIRHRRRNCGDPLLRNFSTHSGSVCPTGWFTRQAARSCVPHLLSPDYTRVICSPHGHHWLQR